MPGGAPKQAILQKHDTAEAAVIQNETKLNYMKTRDLRVNWLIPLLGIAMVAIGVVAGTAYLKIERRADAEEAFTATLDRLYQDNELSMALKTLHEGDAAAAARRLDLLLCEHIVRTDSELPSADARTRAFVENAFQRMALVRPRVAEAKPADPANDHSDDQIVAERILSRALSASPHRAGEAGPRG